MMESILEEKLRIVAGIVDIEKGYRIKGDLPKIDGSLSIIEVAKKLGIRIKGLTEKEIEKIISQKVINNKNLEIYINEEEIELGNPIYYRKKIRYYKLINVREMKKVVKECRKRYLKQKREMKKERFLETNGYG